MKTKRILLASFLLLVGVVLTYYLIGFANKHKRPKNNSKFALVHLTQVHQRSVPIQQTTTGTIEAIQQTELRPQISGYVKALHFEEGSYVKEGAVLVELDNAQQKQNLLSAKVQTNLTKSTYSRYSKLQKRHMISPQVLDQYRADYEKAKAAEKASQAALDEMTLSAPISGFIGAKSITKGDFVSSGMSLLKIVNTNTLKIRYALPSRYVSMLKVGQSVRLTGDFMPGKVFYAKVSYIAPDIDEDTQTIEIHAIFNNQKHVLTPGQSLDVTQRLGVRKDAVLIPVDSVITNVSGNVIYTVKGNKVVAKPVVVGEHYGNDVVILRGLNAKDKVVTKGQFQIKPGSLVRIDKPKRKS